MVKFKSLDKNKINSLPKTIGVYAFKQGKNFLYIGKAVNIKQRVENHFKQPVFKDDIFILPKADKVGYIKTNSEIEALLLEAELIKKYQPKYNVMWRDSKNYFWVAIAKDEFPQVFITHQPSPHFLPPPCGRGENKRGTGLNYLGPFVDGKALKQTLKILRGIFPFRTCRTLPKKKCLFYDLKLCPGPCLHKFVTTFDDRKKLKQKEYLKNIRNLVKVLGGKKQQALRELKREMKTASQNQDFERAAGLRDQIFALENVFLHSHILEGAKLLPERMGLSSFVSLQKLLGEKTKIKRIEGYDVSNIQGKEATGSMVVFENGLPDKAEYRKFKIKIAGKPDDIAMLKEMLGRRFAHLEWPLPQVILIDGGKAQLNIASAVKCQMSNVKCQIKSKCQISNIKMVSLAKRKNELFIERRKKPILLKTLPREISNLILQIRDEAHRFAISYHKKLRSKGFLKN